MSCSGDGEVIVAALWKLKQAVSIGNVGISVSQGGLFLRKHWLMLG